jgi:hypothetical protein
MGTVIHCSPHIPWQLPFALKMQHGLNKRGIVAELSDAPVRSSDQPILLGTTLWKSIERDGGEFLLVDRCHYGDTNDWVAIAKNGRGGRAQWPTETDPVRWNRYGQQMLPWRVGGSRVVLCGQVGSYSPDWTDEASWAASVKGATHFRPHPQGGNPTRLPLVQDWHDVGCAIVLNSSVAVQTVLCGIPTVTMDRGSMAWSVTGHQVGDIVTPDREPWAHWLAWCQWSHDEINEGIPWDYLW